MDAKRFIKFKRIQLFFLVAGATGGFLYWRFIGCESGTCAIRSVWYWSTLWGAAMGYLIGDLIDDFLVKHKKKKENEG